MVPVRNDQAVEPRFIMVLVLVSVYPIMARILER